jgi:hypothetical protein
MGSVPSMASEMPSYARVGPSRGPNTAVIFTPVGVLARFEALAVTRDNHQFQY